MVAVCARRNFRHVVPVRRLGAGGIFSALRTQRVVDALTRWPTLSSRRAARHALRAMGMYQGLFLALCADVGRRSAPGLRKTITRDHFLQQQQRHPPRQPRDPRRGDRAPGSQGGSGGRDTPGWCDVSTPPVVRFENEASAQSLTDQDIDDRLARVAVISNTALAICQAKARPGFGTRAPCTRTRQVAGAGEAQLAQAAGQSRGARC